MQSLGRYVFTVAGWVDHMETWRHGLAKKFEAGQDVEIFAFASDVDADQRMEIDRMGAMLNAIPKERHQ